MINYLIQVTVCLGLFYSVYYFLLRGDKFFNLQRAYLLGTLFLSISIPLIDLSSFRTEVVNQLPVVANAFSFMEVPAPQVVPEQSLSLGEIFLIAYGVIVLMLSFRFFMTVRSLLTLIKKGDRESYGRYTMIYTDKQILIASFFKYIFIEKSMKFEKESLDYMLIHEKKHIRDFHFIDLIVLEVIKILFWINPFVYLHSFSIKSVHEYICDQEVVRYTTPESYEKLLIKSFFNQVGMPLLSQFSETSIKSRLNMIKKQNTVWFKKLKFLTIIPVAFLLVYACNQEDFDDLSVVSQEFSGRVMDTDGNPLPGVNIILEGTKVGVVSDINGRYKIDNSAAGAQQVTFTFIGLETETIDIGAKSIIDVVMGESENIKESKIGAPTSNLTFDEGLSVSGRVLDDKGESMPGVYVIVIGASKGAITDFDGNYKIPAPDQGGLLLYSFEGYESQVINIKNKSVIDIVMAEKEIEISPNN